MTAESLSPEQYETHYFNFMMLAGIQWSNDSTCLRPYNPVDSPRNFGMRPPPPTVSLARTQYYKPRACYHDRAILEG